MTALSDTQSRIDTVIGKTFPYKFGTDFLRRKVVIFYTDEKGTERSMSLFPAEVQQRAADETLDPHRHNMYAAGVEYCKAEGLL